VQYGSTESEKSSQIFRRSLFVVKDIRVGEHFNLDNVRSIRPGFGLPPKHLEQVLQSRAKKNLKRGTPLSWDLIEET
jgi:N-acetylneuraminate synthase